MVQKIRVVGGIAVVTATAEFHPLRQLEQLAGELEAIGFEGKVLIDLLAVNGLADNRFASVRFDGTAFDKASFAVESEVDQGIKSEQDAIARADRSFLLGSVLSSGEMGQFVR